MSFDKWNDLKKSLDSRKKLKYFSEREIWWCSLGKNIGHEQDGKNDLFERPVLIIKQFNLRLFWAIPLTSKLKKHKFYHQYKFNGIKYSAVLSQVRMLDVNRLQRKIGHLNKKDFFGINQ